MKQKLKLPIEISYLRITAQLLLPSTRKQSVTEVADHMLAMQAQQVYSFPHAVLSRTDNIFFSDIKTAFDQQLLVRHRPMRGTVHVTCAKDYHWLRLTLNQRSSGSVLREQSLAGISEPLFNEAAEIAWNAIKNGDDEGISRKELFELWLCYFKDKMTGNVSEKRFCNLLMWGLDRRGLLVEGPLRKNQHLFIDARSLPATDSSASGFCFEGEKSVPAALTELAYRYVLGHGPVSVADLARWASLSKSAAKDALDLNVKRGRLNCYQITESGLKNYNACTNSDSICYMHPDLTETLNSYRNEAENILFLPSFDELHVGYNNRTCLTDELGEAAICPAKNGMFKPLIIKNGRLIAVYPKSGILWLNQRDLQSQRAVDEVVQHIRRRMNQ